MPTSPRYLRHLLLSRSQWMEERVFEKAAQNGYGDITAGMSRLYANLGSGARSLSDLGRRLAISRQAVHKMAQEGIRQGYVELVESEEDARVKLLRFTDKGRAMAASATDTMTELEARIAGRIGAKRLALVKEVLDMAWTDEEVSRKQPSVSPEAKSPRKPRG
ncbi:MarR family winged helix-turn-helix transcriptional regulator [Hydrogenophaga sp. 5NK40-0174]|uniref:MarR family winged helix-turn-helix transcriptional regulator n=1 Tax=Hydrogenophaga sp. 5NK40-0174 TaxID=3127649 RepID=UPI00310BD769